MSIIWRKVEMVSRLCTTQCVGIFFRNTFMKIRAELANSPTPDHHVVFDENGWKITKHLKLD